MSSSVRQRPRRSPDGDRHRRRRGDVMIVPVHFQWTVSAASRRLRSIVLNEKPAHLESYAELETFRTLTTSTDVQLRRPHRQRRRLLFRRRRARGSSVRWRARSRRPRRPAAIHAHDRRSEPCARMSAAGPRWTAFAPCRRDFAMASDVRFGTARSRLRFSSRVSGYSAPMGACALLPQSSARARQRLLYSGAPSTASRPTAGVSIIG